MDSLNIARRAKALFVGVVLSSAVFGSAAQSPATPDGKVPGAQLQAWLDMKFTYAGLHHPSGCFLMNTGEASQRVLFLSCPNGWSEKIMGTARVAGDTLCTNFRIPNTAPGEECLTWHNVGQSRFEQRNEGSLNTSVVVLSMLPAAGR